MEIEHVTYWEKRFIIMEVTKQGNKKVIKIKMKI